MDLGVAGTIKTKHIEGEKVDEGTNKWLDENPEVEVIDIKFSVTSTEGEYSSEALIIYREE